MLGADFAQRLEKTGFGCDQVHVADHWLDDDGGDGVTHLGKHLLDAFDVVVLQHQCVRGEFSRYASRVRVAEREHAGAGLHQQAVAMAVIAALELDDARAAGEAARQADGTHGRLGATAGQAHHLQARHQPA